MNGLASARRGLTNGITNGNGFTNGLGAPQFARDSHRGRWKLYLIPLVSVLLILLPLFAPQGSVGPGRPITIDGFFTDWPTASLIGMAPNPQISPNIDIVRFGVVENVGFLAFYVEVAGAALEGGGPSPGTMDGVRIFLDVDASQATGYSIDGVGADRMLEVLGVRGAIETSRLWEFDSSRDSADWNGWTKPIAAIAVAKGSRIEAEVDQLDLSPGSNPMVAIALTQAWDGQMDATEAPLTPGLGTLTLAQEFLAPELLSGVNVPLLRITAVARGQAVTFTSLGVRTLGTAPSESATELRLIDRDGGLLSQQNPASSDVRFDFPTETVDVGTVATYTIVGDFPTATGRTFGLRVPSAQAVGTAGGGIVALRASPGGGSVGYVGVIPSSPRVDGGFAEWANASMDLGGESGLRGNSDIDVRGYGAAARGSSTFLYADVAGRIFAGVSILARPQVASVPGSSSDTDLDGVPDDIDPLSLDFNNDGWPDSQANGDVDGDGITDYRFAGGTDYWLNTTIPASFPSPYAGRDVSVYIGPTNRPVLTGADVLRLFLEVDNRTLTGYAIAGIGADRMVEVRGTDGEVTQSAVLAFAGSFPGDWAWTPVSPVTVATGYRAIELAVSFNASSVYLEMGDFWGGVDTTNPGPSRAPAVPSINTGTFGAGPKTSFDAAPAAKPLTVSRQPVGPGLTGSPAPPRVLDIPGNQVYYLRDTTHPTENDPACTTDKVADAGPRVAPVNTITLSTTQSACWYLDATTGTTIPAGDWESLLDVSVSSTYSAKAGAFNIGTGGIGTTVPVTGVGFQPKVVIFWHSGRTESTDTAGTATHQRGFGVAVSTTDRRAVCSISVDNGANAAAYAEHRTDEAICSVDTTGAIDGLADLSSMDANGFTLVIDDAFAASLRIHYLALGGASLTNAATGMFTESTTTGNQDVTTAGFQPDAVLLFSSGIASDPPGTAGFPQVGGSATSSRDTNDVADVVTLPSGVAAGDLVLVFHHADGAGTRTFPSPWVEIKDATSPGGASNIGVAYLIASGGETSVTVTKSVTERFTAIAIRITMQTWHGTTPPEISTGATGTSANPNPDSVTASWGSASNLFIAAHGFNNAGGDGTTAYPTNYGSNQIESPDISSAARGAIATRELTASNDNPGTFTISSSDEWWAGTVVVRPADTDSRMMVGLAAGASNPSDVVWAGVSNNAAATTQTVSYSRAGESIALFGVGAGGVTGRGEVDAWLSNGFSLNWNEATTNGRRIHYLALKGGSYVVGDLLTQTDTTTTMVESGFGFSPKASLFLSHNKAASTADTVQDHDEMSIGAFSSTADRGAQCVIDVDAADPSNVGTAVEHDEVYCNLSTAATPAIEGVMGIQTVGSDGFTLVMDDADPVASFVGYMAFGADVDYAVYLEIWDKTADSVRAAVGSCLGVTAAGDDQRCLLSGVASQTIASNEVVRIRVVHSGSVGTVSIEYDDTDTSGDSRVTIPPTGIPEFEDVVLPALATVLVPVVWQWSQRRRPSKRGREVKT